MDFEFPDITNLSEEELISVLNHNFHCACMRKKEIEKLEKAVDNTNTTKVEIPKVVSFDTVVEEDESEADFEKEVEYYLSEFLKLKDYDENSIMEVLPSRNSYNYADVVLRIIAEIGRDIKDIRAIIIADGSSMSKNDLIEYRNEIKSNIDKVSLLKKVLYESKEDVSSEKVSNKLIFAPIKNSDKIRVFDELKDIPIEQYEDFLELFESIKDGTFKNIRRFVNSEILKGALEVKGYQVRVVFQRISKDCYGIISMFVKKTQNDRIYRNQLENKYTEYKEIAPTLKEKVKDEEFLKKHMEYEKELFKELSKNKNTDRGCK